YLLGEYRKSADDLKRALQLRPDYDEAKNVLAKAQSAMDRADVVVLPPAMPTHHDVVEAPASVPAPPTSTPAPAPVPVPIRVAKVAAPKTSAPKPVETKPVESKPVESKTAAAHNQVGRDLLNQGKYRESIAELDAAIEQQKDFALAYNARGFAYYL